jgi:RimJ/RimL family protein N-acetyltransferase
VSDVPELRTPRLLLRGWRESDRASFAAINADPSVMAWFPAPLTREQSDAFVDRIESVWVQRGYGLWAVEHRAGTGGPDGLAGYVGLMPVLDLPVDGEVEVGWRLARTHWGHGDATEGARAVLGWAVEVLGLTEVVSFTAASNTRSRAVMERLGMLRDASADFDHPRVPADSPLRPHVLYRLRLRPRAQAGSGGSATAPVPTRSKPRRA